ncbi:MAG: phosphoenolpyruvate carboxylase, partial [Methyloceanibacter sp.]
MTDPRPISEVGVRTLAMNEDVRISDVVDQTSNTALITGTSPKYAAQLLFELLLDVVRRHEPAIEPILAGGAEISIAEYSPELMARALSAQGIWFQLLSIADQNATMRRRRHIERERGRDDLLGSFDNVIDRAKGVGVGPREIETLLQNLRIRPVITAHPTESKRITVLEKYRKIYLLLLELENARWTKRERYTIIANIRDQIELVWMTGELHLQKPTVEHEVLRGLHFFDEALFERAPEVLELLQGALKRHYPDEQFDLPPFFQFGSWIGGDRDGNPFVTTEVTGWALRKNAMAALNYYYGRLVALARSMSISQRALPIPETFQEELAGELRASGDGEAIAERNPGEPYRQFLTCILRKLDATMQRANGKDIEVGTPHYTNADELIHDLRRMERALSDVNSPTIA